MTRRTPAEPAAGDGALLAAEGIELSALDAGTVPVDLLTRVLEANTPASLALARRLADSPQPQHAEALAAAEARAHGPLRREIRRTLFRLCRAGITPAPPLAPGAPAQAPAEDDARAAEGWVSHVDGRGDRLVWITRPLPGGLLFISARTNDIDGLCALAVYETSKRQLRRQRDELRDRHGLQMAPVDWRHADALIAAAGAHRAPSEGPAYPTVRVRLTRDPPIAPDPALPAALLEAANEPGLIEASIELAQVPEMQSWVPSPEHLERYAREILDAQESPLVLSQHQQGDRISGIAERATRDLFPAATCGPRLEAMADYLWRTDRARAASIALATARALKAGTPATAIPLLAGLVRTSLAVVHRALHAHAKQEERGSLIIKPGSPEPPGSPRR
jgi:hypothetical protein